MSRTFALAGDSQAQGLEDALRAVLTRAGNTFVGARVQPGISTARAWEQGLFDGPNVDVLVVALGGNDMLPITPASQQIDAYRLILARAVAAARGRARRVVWIGPMWAIRRDVDEKHARAAVVQQGTIPGLGAAWFSGRALSRGLEMQPDGVHFTRASYAAMAGQLLGIFEPTTGARAMGAVALSAVALTLAGLGGQLLAE